MAYLSRRHLLLGAGAAGFSSSLSALTGLGAQQAWAADTSGYKALVCIFLFGGMDHGDTVIPYDQSEYNLLSGTVREGLFNTYDSDNAASTRNRNNLLPLNPSTTTATDGRQFALPAELSPLHTMFDAGDLAIVGGVGPLIEPTTRAAMDAGTAILPKRLFSHNDQQSTWMALSTEGARYGWGGRMVDILAAQQSGQNTSFTSISTGSSNVFLSGQDTTPFRVSGNGANFPAILDRRYYLGGTDADDAARAAIRSHFANADLDDSNIYSQDLRSSMSRSITNSELMIEARENATPFVTQFPGNSVGRQLQQVAETIRIQQFLNVSRQIFFVSTGGYDTHNNQANQIGNLHNTLATGMAAFKEAMQEINRWNDVAMFTASDFGRTQIDNGDGTDHGWGGHQFVAGGQVRGGELYGRFPVTDPDAPDYTESRGRVIPSVSVEQYASTLGSWFGLNSGEINTVLPNLGNFNSSNLGFMSNVSV